MATRPKSSAKSKSGLLSGIIIGLIIGLALAVAAALYISKAPIPFMDKVSTSNIDELLSSKGGYGVDESLGQDADPNIGLYGGSTSADSALFQGKEAQIAKELGNIAMPTPPTISTPKETPTKSENLDNLIAQLNEPNTKPTTVANAQNATAYYLQAGAFRSAKDAEAVRARILLLGLNAHIQEGAYDGGTINRVRVGPFNGADEMNQARATLGKEKIETSVVRP